MWVFGLICIIAFGTANSAYSSSGSKSSSGGTRYRPVAYAPSYGYGYADDGYGDGYGGSYGGGYGDGYGDGYVGSFAGSGNGFPGVFDPFTFAFDHQNGETYTDTKVLTTDDAFAKAEASLLPDDVAIQNQIAAVHANNLLFQDQLTASILGQQAYLANQAAGASRYGNRRGKPGHVSFVGGSVSSGPNGVRHTTFVYPPNAKSPNVISRVGGVSSGGVVGGGPGFVGFSSSGFSTNVNGKHQGGSLTLVNNNGKVTGYRTHS